LWGVAFYGGSRFCKGVLVPSLPIDPRKLAEQLWSPQDLPDRRLWNRLRHSVAVLFRRWDGLTTHIPRGPRRGMQRLFNNPRINAESLAAKAHNATLDAIRSCSLVLLAHDSSEINKVGRSEPDDAGPLRSSHARGYLLHGCTAVDLLGSARLGLLDATAWTRSWSLRNQNHKHRLPHLKESIKWRRGIRRAQELLAASNITTHVIHAMDSEGDVHENFSFALRKRINVVVRAAQDRAVDAPEGLLWAHLQAQPCRGKRTLKVPTQANETRKKEAQKAGGKELKSFEQRVSALGSEREATVELSYAKVTLSGGKKKKYGRKPVQVQAVYVREREAPKEAEGLEWLLLTTLEVNSEESGWLVVKAYRARWASEEIHRVLKTCFHLEKEPVDGIQSFRRQLAVLLPLATQVVQWTYAARERPGESAQSHLSKEILTAISQAAKFKKLKVTRPPRTLLEAITRLAQLGGYEPRKDRFPGFQLVWRGWRSLLDFLDLLHFAKNSILSAPD